VAGQFNQQASAHCVSEAWVSLEDMIMKIKNLLPAVRSSAGRDDDHPFYSLQRQMNSLFDDFFFRI